MRKYLEVSGNVDTFADNLDININMKKLFTLAILAMSFMMTMAQQQHSVSAKATSFKLASSNDGLTYSYQYDDQDRLSMVNVKTNKESYDISAIYEDEQFTAKYTQYGSVITFNYSIQDDRVVKETVNISGVNGSIDLTYTFTDKGLVQKCQYGSKVHEYTWDGFGFSSYNLQTDLHCGRRDLRFL